MALPIVLLAVGTYATRWAGVYIRAKGSKRLADIDRYSHLAAVTLLAAVVTTETFGTEGAGPNVAVIAAVAMAGVLAIARRSLLTIVIVAAVTAALLHAAGAG